MELDIRSCNKLSSDRHVYTTVSPQRIHGFTSNRGQRYMFTSLGDFHLKRDHNKFERCSEATTAMLGNCNFFLVIITNPINQQAYLTWYNRLQQACALELVSTFLERWAAGRFYILKCHCCQRVDGFPLAESKLRGEKKRKRNLLCGWFNVSCYRSVKNRKGLSHTKNFLIHQDGGVAVCLHLICTGTWWPLGLERRNSSDICTPS